MWIDWSVSIEWIKWFLFVCWRSFLWLRSIKLDLDSELWFSFVNAFDCWLPPGIIIFNYVNFKLNKIAILGLHQKSIRWNMSKSMQFFPIPNFVEKKMFCCQIEKNIFFCRFCSSTAVALKLDVLMNEKLPKNYITLFEWNEWNFQSGTFKLCSIYSSPKNNEYSIFHWPSCNFVNIVVSLTFGVLICYGPPNKLLWSLENQMVNF